MKHPLVEHKPDLPERVAQALRKVIPGQTRPGAKLDTIRTLCQRYAVSVNTMRAALSILAREGIIEMRHGSGIYVSEHVDQRPIGVLMEIDISMPDVSFFWRRVTQQVRLRLAEQGLTSRFYAGFHQPGEPASNSVCPEFLDDAMRDRLQGVIVTHGSPRPDWAEPMQQRGVPIVGHWAAFENYVTFDLPEQVRTATRRLLDAGRRKLAFMDWGSQRPSLDSRDELFDAFSETLAEHGVPLNEHWVRCEFHPNIPGAGWEEFREIWTGSADKPDGLVVGDDVLFRGVARAIGEFGIRVPEQLLVATHANRGAMEEYPFPLWRMVTDPDAAAQAQVDLLVALLRGEPVTQRQINLPVQFVVPDPAVADRPGTREVEQVTMQRSS